MTDVLGGFGVALLSNKGIAARCDRRIPDEFPDGRNYVPVPAFAGALASRKLPDNLIADPQSYSDIRDGELIWVRVSWLKSFIKQVLPLVKAKVVLVTADSDSCVPAELGADARVLLESPKIIHWYAQNYDGSVVSGKISPVPIGIDFHTLSQGPQWGESKSSPEQQEAVLKSLAAELRPREERIQQVYLDFAWKQSWGLRDYRRYHPLIGTRFHENRRRITNKLKNRDAVFCQTGPLPRTETWRRRGEYAFVLSPHGLGLDCHRTWEALALGHIVLVPASSVDSLYTGLPVVSLQNWNEVTSGNLKKWLLQFQGNYGIQEKLKNSYWIAKMRASASHLVSP